MRHVNQEEEANNQQMAVEQQTYVNEANAQLVLTNASLRRKWEAEPDDDEEHERLKNDFFHARFILRTMTEDRGQAGARVFAAEQALDTDQREHPENPSAALAEAYAAHSANYDLRTSMIDDFLESKREKPLPRKKNAKKGRPAAEKAAARAAKQAVMLTEAEATADEETSARPEDQEAHNPETPPRAEDYFGYESAGSKAASSVSRSTAARIVRRSTRRTDTSTTEAMQTATVTATARNTSLGNPTTRRIGRRSSTTRHHYSAKRRKRTLLTTSPKARPN